MKTESAPSLSIEFELNVLQDVQYADIDYMDRQLNFVLDPEFSKLPALVERIQDEGGRFIIILVICITAVSSSITSGREKTPLNIWPTGCDVIPGSSDLRQWDGPLPRL